MLNLPDGVIPIDHGVAKYRVTYTMDYLGEPFEVSGALFVPVDEAGDAGECAMPTHTYMHGTIFRRIDAPSYNGFEGQLGFIMATAGAACLMPDYLGLGSSDDVLDSLITGVKRDQLSLLRRSFAQTSLLRTVTIT